MLRICKMLRYNHPWWYEFLDPIVHVLRCEQDFRSNTGLLCILQYELDPDTRALGQIDKIHKGSIKATRLP